MRDDRVRRIQRSHHLGDPAETVGDHLCAEGSEELPTEIVAVGGRRLDRSEVRSSAGVGESAEAVQLFDGAEFVSQPDPEALHRLRAGAVRRRPRARLVPDVPRQERVMARVALDRPSNEGRGFGPNEGLVEAGHVPADIEGSAGERSERCAVGAAAHRVVAIEEPLRCRLQEELEDDFQLFGARQLEESIQIGEIQLAFVAFVPAPLRPELYHVEPHLLDRDEVGLPLAREGSWLTVVLNTEGQVRERAHRLIMPDDVTPLCSKWYGFGNE